MRGRNGHTVEAPSGEGGHVAADFYYAETENGDRVDDPSEADLRKLVSSLDDGQNTYVVVQAGDEESSWYVSVARDDSGGHEIVLRDPLDRTHHVRREVDGEAIASDVDLWIARRDFRERPTRPGVRRPDIAALARLAGLNPAEAEPLLPWDAAQDIAGIRLPSDYRAFLDLFGPGELRGELAVVRPHPLPGQTLGVGAVSRMLNSLDREAAAWPGPGPYRFRPEPGGLLYWGANYSGDHCFWLTEGDDPDRWPVVLWLRCDPDRWHRYDLGMARFLLLALSGEDPTLNLLGLADSTTPVWVPETDTDPTDAQR
jgi:hypothetical protein